MPIRVGIIGAGGNTTALHIPVRAPSRDARCRTTSSLLPAPAFALLRAPAFALRPAPLLRSPLSAAAQLLQAQDGVEVAVVCNRSDESSQRVADEFDIPRIASK